RRGRGARRAGRPARRSARSGSGGSGGMGPPASRRAGAPRRRLDGDGLPGRPGEELAGVREGGRGDLAAGQHAGDLLDPRGVRPVTGPAAGPPATSLLTRKWWSAWLATCGRWVTARIWPPWARRWSFLPRAAAWAPPTPESTSSKTRVGRPVSPSPRAASWR